MTADANWIAALSGGLAGACLTIAFQSAYRWLTRPILEIDFSDTPGCVVPLKSELKTSSRIAELSQHEADGGELQEGEAAAVEIFPVLGETAAAIEPSNRAFYDPTLG